jgi:hypothetical protein
MRKHPFSKICELSFGLNSALNNLTIYSNLNNNAPSVVYQKTKYITYTYIKRKVISPQVK